MKLRERRGVERERKQWKQKEREEFIESEKYNVLCGICAAHSQRRRCGQYSLAVRPILISFQPFPFMLLTAKSNSAKFDFLEASVFLVFDLHLYRSLWTHVFPPAFSFVLVFQIPPATTAVPHETLKFPGPLQPKRTAASTKTLPLNPC